jgi:hypothetical protein
VRENRSPVFRGRHFQDELIVLCVRGLSGIHSAIAICKGSWQNVVLALIIRRLLVRFRGTLRF